MWVCVWCVYCTDIQQFINDDDTTIIKKHNLLPESARTKWLKCSIAVRINAARTSTSDGNGDSDDAAQFILFAAACCSLSLCLSLFIGSYSWVLCSFCGRMKAKAKLRSFLHKRAQWGRLTSLEYLKYLLLNIKFTLFGYLHLLSWSDWVYHSFP